MEVSRGRTSAGAVPGAAFAHHTGKVWLDAVLEAQGVSVNDANYAACALTSWHTHDQGQLIMVTHGRGVVATRAGEVTILGPGDLVHAPAGEEHWHGAAPDCFVTYRSISWGTTSTAEPVDDQTYLAALTRLG